MILESGSKIANKGTITIKVLLIKVDAQKGKYLSKNEFQFQIIMDLFEITELR